MQHALGCEIQQFVFAAQQRCDSVRQFALRQARVDEGCRDAVVLQQPHLILHERDQRRDHQRDAAAEDGRQLKAQRLAAAGGHDGQHIAACQRVSDDGFLPRAEAIETEPAAQGAGQRCVRTIQRVHPR